MERELRSARFNQNSTILKHRIPGISDEDQHWESGTSGIGNNRKWLESRWWPSTKIDGRPMNFNHSRRCHDDQFLIGNKQDSWKALAFWHKRIFASTVTLLHLKIMKVSKEKLVMLRMIEFSLLWIFIIVIKFTIIIADGRQWLTANSRRTLIRRWLFGVYSSPAADDIFAHYMPNWVKLLPIYESDIGQAAGSLISRPSSPLSALNAYKSSTTHLYFLTGMRSPFIEKSMFIYI